MSQPETQSYVLHVGDFAVSGGFASPTWPGVARWCGERATEILIYYYPRSDIVPRRVAAIGLHAAEEAFPDPAVSILGLRFSGTSEQRILALETLVFDPEVGVTHLMCLAGPLRDLADLETDDDDNFLLLNLTPSEMAELVARLPPLDENVRTCALWASSIDDKFEPGHTWKALGDVTG
jgi:hypothetical protein